MFNCIGAKCPEYKFYPELQRHCCELDNSVSHHMLVECRVKDFYKDIEERYLKLKNLYDLIKENNKKCVKVKVTKAQSQLIWYSNSIGQIFEVDTYFESNEDFGPIIYKSYH